MTLSFPAERHPNGKLSATKEPHARFVKAISLQTVGYDDPVAQTPQ